MGLFINLGKIVAAIYKFLGAGGSQQISENSRRNLVEVWLALVDLLGWSPDGWPKYVSLILLWNGSKTCVHDKIHTSRLAQKGTFEDRFVNAWSLEVLMFLKVTFYHLKTLGVGWSQGLALYLGLGPPTQVPFWGLQRQSSLKMRWQEI